MQLRILIILLIGFFTPAFPVIGQEASAERLEVLQSGEAYLRAVRLRRIKTDVVYYDPTGPAPRLDTRQRPERQADRSKAIWSISNLPTALIAIAVLIAIANFSFRFGGGVSVSFGRDPENSGRARAAARGVALAGAARPKSVDAILNIPDRREALMMLAQNALATTVETNGILLQRSWTARDALRRIPKDQEHLDALRALVLASERVHFGGRDVTEDEFKLHLSTIRPIFGQGLS